MKWLDDYNIGIEEIDSQHKELFKILIQFKQSFSKDDDTIESLMKRADALMYNSKKAGKNRLTLG